MAALAFVPHASLITAAVGAFVAGSSSVWLFHWSGDVALVCLPLFGAGAVGTALGRNGLAVVLKRQSIREQLDSVEYGSIVLRLFLYVFLFSLSFGVSQLLFF